MKTYKRINKLAEAVDFVHEILNKNLVICDIGTDHGYLAEKTSCQDYVDKVIATDISSKSLQKLVDLIKLKDLKKIETRVGDGLSVIDSADVTIIAGIGGFEIISMLEKQNKQINGKNKCNYFILQPAQNVVELRHWIFDKKIKLISDYVICDADRFYPILIINISEKKRTRKNIFNIWLGRDNKVSDEDFFKFLIEVYDSLAFFKTLTKKRIRQDKMLKEKFILYKMIEKLIDV